MTSEKDTAQTSKSGGRISSATPSIALLNQKLGTSPAPRMLTPYEIDLLRQCAKETGEVTHEYLKRKERALENPDGRT